MGNQQFEDVLETYGDLVYRFALTRLQNREDAEDVFQNTFLKLLERSEWKHWDQEHLRAWLLRVACNECADVGRQRKRQTPLSDQDLEILAGHQVTPEESEVWKEVAGLDEPDRSIVFLHYGEGYSLKEIAGMLGLSYTNCRVILHRARRKLKETMIGGNCAERSEYEQQKDLSKHGEKYSCAGRT